MIWSGSSNDPVQRVSSLLTAFFSEFTTNLQTFCHIDQSTSLDFEAEIISGKTIFKGIRGLIYGCVFCLAGRNYVQFAPGGENPKCVALKILAFKILAFSLNSPTHVELYNGASTKLESALMKWVP